MSYYDDASLVVIPSGYKTSKVYAEKPTDGSGDLAFTRTGDTATRVSSNGLIEKVRTNLVLQSNTFSSASWTKFGGVTVTSGQAGYDGTNNAWLITKPAAGFTGVGQAYSNTGVITGSFYLKAGTLTKATVRLIGTPDVNVIFDLANGVIFGGTSTGWLARTITSVGNGWYRCSLALNATLSSTFIVYPDEITNTTAGTIFAQNAQLEAGDIATDPILTTSAAVSVGPVANVPRLDYLGSTCGKLLLEPQRTNLVTYSEQFDNAAWGKTTATVTANTTSAPDGTISADTFDATNNFAFVSQAPTLASGTATTYSVFVKNIDAPYVNLQVRTTATAGLARFDFTGSTLTSTTLTTGTSSSFADYGNGWYRCVLVCTTSEANQQFRVQVPSTGDSVFIWGAQVEAGAYPTSYIPTLAASATRGADACSKTGISSLIGQTEGTLFVEVNDAANTGTIDRVVAIGDGTGNNRIIVLKNATGNIFFFVASGGSTIINQTNIAGTSLVNGNYKIAVAYKSGEYAIYRNGASVFTSTAATVPATSNYYLAVNEEGGVSAFSGKFSQALLFKTRLTNDSLAELTSL